MAVAVATMKAVQVSTAGADLKVVEMEIPDPGAGQVRIKVHACGVCLSHLGIQFANKFGYKVAAVGRGSQIESLAMRLGADVYIDSKVKKPAEELQKLGGAKVIIATAPDSKAMAGLIGGLGP
jgi:D-arabinose 1-dehydrogenase-like Zn-dependent alcohol dehydrogenase